MFATFGLFQNAHHLLFTSLVFVIVLFVFANAAMLDVRVVFGRVSRVGLGKFVIGDLINET